MAPDCPCHVQSVDGPIGGTVDGTVLLNCTVCSPVDGDGSQGLYRDLSKETCVLFASAGLPASLVWGHGVVRFEGGVPSSLSRASWEGACWWVL
jgi:hypothetical protein